jgi:hypothetical protein
MKIQLVLVVANLVLNIGINILAQLKIIAITRSPHFDTLFCRQASSTDHKLI